MRGLEGKVVVTCASGMGDGKHIGASIGAVTARRLAAEGAKVVVGDISDDAARRTVDLIVADGGTAVPQVYDAGDEEQTKALMNRAVQEYGALHGVHFNATNVGVSSAEGEHDLTTLPLDMWHSQLDVSLLGFVLAARHAIPLLLEQGGGAIVGTSSGAAYVGQPFRVAYAAAKAGMGAVIRHIASRWGQEGIRANLVSPGFVPSPRMLANEQLMATIEPNRSPRFGKPDDIASMVTFLISDEGEWVQAQAICVDGGTVMRP